MEGYLEFISKVRERKVNIISEQCWELRNKFCSAIHRSESRHGFDGATVCMDCPFSIKLGFLAKTSSCDIFLCENDEKCTKIMEEYLASHTEPKNLEESNRLFMRSLIGYSNRETEEGLRMLCTGLAEAFNAMSSASIAIAKEKYPDKVGEITDLFGNIQEIYKNKIKEWVMPNCDFAIDSSVKINLAEEMVELYKYLHVTVMEMLKLEW